MELARRIQEMRATVIAGVVVVACLVAAFVFLLPRASEGARLVARVHDADGATYGLPLDKDDQLTVTTSLGTNVIVVSGGAAHVAEADCPTGACLHQQPISLPGQQLICLPHQLWVEVVEQGAPDGELDVTAVTDGSGDNVDLVSR